MKTPEGYRWCGAHLYNLMVWSPISWDTVTLVEQDAVAAMLTAVLNFCWSGQKSVLRIEFEHHPSLLELLDSIGD